MFDRRRNKKRKNYSVKKRGMKDENIDRQITVIHRAIAEKLIANPELVEQVRDKLVSRREQGKLSYGQFITCFSMLELIDKPEEFIQHMTEDSLQMRKLRRKTPFVGILTEEERQQALENNAVGFVDSISVLLS